MNLFLLSLYTAIIDRGYILTLQGVVHNLRRAARLLALAQRMRSRRANKA